MTQTPDTPFLSLCRRRRSVRKYRPEALQPEQAEQLLQAALLAPSSKGRKAVEYIVVDEPETLARLADVKPRFGRMIAGAALAVVVCGRMDQSDVWIEDASVAATTLLYAAADLGLGACWVQLRERQTALGEPASAAVKQLLAIPPEAEPLCVVAVGLPEAQPQPHDTEALLWEHVHIGKY